MILKSDFIQIHYELAMSIGTSLDLTTMLRHCLTAVLKKMKCPAGGVHFFEKKSDGKYCIKNVITIPRDTYRISSYQTVLRQISSNMSYQELADFNKTLPLIGQTGNESYYVLQLPDFGVIVLLNNGDLDPLFIKSLDPILKNLAVACNACLQNEELIHHQYNLKELVAQRTDELVKKNQQLTLEIEQRKKSEEAHRKGEEKYRELVQNANSIFLGWDTKGKVTFFNEYAQTFFGFSENEIIGKHVVGTIAPETETTGRDLRPLINDICQHPHKYEYHVNENMKKDGTRVWVAWSNKIFKDEQGDLLGVLSIGSDITDRKKAEQELIESEERYRALFTNEIDAICIFEIETKIIVDANDAWLKLYGYQKGEIGSMTTADVSAEQNSTQKAINQSAKSGMVFIPVRYHRKKDGTVFIVELSAGPFTWKGQKLMYALVRDITERQIAYDELQKARDASEAANKAKSAFLANMSHELRTPLNAILGFSQILSNSPNLNPGQKENLQIINRSGEHLLTLINDILDMSKIEAGQITLKENDIDLPALLTDIKNLFKVQIKKKRLTLKIEQSDIIPPFIRVDEAKLRQVLMNLISNAVKFTEEGKISVKINIEKNKKQPHLDRLLFEIIDTGPGIQADDLEHLFEPFVQLSADQKSHEGTGLGLSISRKFVNLMGGDINVKTQVGQGTNFQFTIILKEGNLDKITTVPNCRIIGLKSKETYRILVVDDITSNRQLLIQLLAPIGFDVQEAQNGREAIAISNKWHPHLILMDIRMPVMDGYEATRHMKNSSTGKNLIIIAISASAFEDKKDDALASGCDDFIAKPFKESVLFERIQKHLGVKYIYDHLAQNGFPESTTDKQTSLSPEMLKNIPSEWKVKMKQAIEHVDLSQIHILIEQIRDQNSALANSIRLMIDQFEYEKILETLK